MIFWNEERERKYRTLFESLKKYPRIQYEELAEVLGVDWRTVASRMKEAFDEGYIVGPQIRKKSFKNFPEYVYLIKSDNPIQLYRNFITNEHILYHAIMNGFANVWAITDEILDIDEKVVVWGAQVGLLLITPPLVALLKREPELHCCSMNRMTFFSFYFSKGCSFLEFESRGPAIQIL